MNTSTSLLLVAAVALQTLTPAPANARCTSNARNRAPRVGGLSTLKGTSPTFAARRTA
jgi:hypothetical protein